MGSRPLALTTLAAGTLLIAWGCAAPGAPGTPGGSSGGASTPSATASVPPTGAALASFPVGADPRGLALDSRGFVWVAVHDSNTVVKIADGQASDSLSVVAPEALAFDATGDLWVGTDAGVYGFSPSGAPIGSVAGPAVEAIAVHGSTIVTSLPSLGVVRAFSWTGTSLGPGQDLVSGGGTPHDLLFDSSGNLWVAEGQANEVARYDAPVTADEAPALLACGCAPQGLTLDASGSVYAIGDSSLVDVSASPSIQVAQDSRLAGALRLAADTQGRFWVAGRSIDQIVLVTPGASVSTLPTAISEPYDILMDLAGNAWVSSESNGQVVELSGS